MSLKKIFLFSALIILNIVGWWLQLPAFFYLAINTVFVAGAVLGAVIWPSSPEE